MKNKEFNIIEFYIAITNRCNLQCIMCTTGKGKYDAEKELTTEQWEKAILNLENNCRIQRVTFGGGEPLLRKDIVEIVKFACAVSINTVNIISNGVLLDESFTGSFSEKELHKIGIIFSIDGLEYGHNFIRGSGVFQKVFNNFEAVYRNYFNTRRINYLSLSSILMPENFAGYISFFEFFRKYRGVRIDIQPIIPNNELCYVRGKFMLTEREKSALKEIIDYIVQNPDISTRPVPLIKYYDCYFDNRLGQGRRCLTGFESLNITFEGYPYLCGKQILMPLDKFDFKEIFNSAEYQNELERIKMCKEPCLQGLHINPDNDYKPV